MQSPAEETKVCPRACDQLSLGKDKPSSALAEGPGVGAECQAVTVSIKLGRWTMTSGTGVIGPMLPGGTVTEGTLAGQAVHGAGLDAMQPRGQSSA